MISAGTILVVDDTQASLKLITDILTKEFRMFFILLPSVS
jgi:PleD family two-component response regulator